MVGRLEEEIGALDESDDAKSATLGGIFGRFGTLIAVGEVTHA